MSRKCKMESAAFVRRRSLLSISRTTSLQGFPRCALIVVLRKFAFWPYTTVMEHPIFCPLRWHYSNETPEFLPLEVAPRARMLLPRVRAERSTAGCVSSSAPRAAVCLLFACTYACGLMRMGRAVQYYSALMPPGNAPAGEAALGRVLAGPARFQRAVLLRRVLYPKFGMAM